VRLDTPATRAYNAGKELMRPSGPGPVVYGGDSMSQQTVDLFKFVALRSPDEPQASALSLGYIRDDRVDLVDRHPLPDVTPDREDFGRYLEEPRNQVMAEFVEEDERTERTNERDQDHPERRVWKRHQAACIRASTRSRVKRSISSTSSIVAGAA